MALGNGARLHLTMADVFPQGCLLVPDSIIEAQEYDEKKGGPPRQAVDRVTGKLVWQCRVSDSDDSLKGRSRETVVKILADRMPVPPTGVMYEPVDFDGLQITPYVDSGRCQGTGRCRARMAFSIRATGVKAARASVSKDAA